MATSMHFFRAVHAFPIIVVSFGTFGLTGASSGFATLDALVLGNVLKSFVRVGVTRFW